eukprot:1161341-Pelagomonas_calceolata.AAC.11
MWCVSVYGVCEYVCVCAHVKQVAQEHLAWTPPVVHAFAEVRDWNWRPQVGKGAQLSSSSHTARAPRPVNFWQQPSSENATAHSSIVLAFTLNMPRQVCWSRITWGPPFV